LNKPNSTCKLVNCDRPERSGGRGYCDTHYMRVLRGISLDKPIRSTGKMCKTDGCDNIGRIDRGGYCKVHYVRKKSLVRWKDRATASMWFNMRARARRLGVPFDLPKEELKIPEVCPILGIPLIRSAGSGTNSDNSPSVDRIVPEKGYVVGNVHVISFRANRIKNDATLEELIKITEYFKAIHETV